MPEKRLFQRFEQIFKVEYSVIGKKEKKEAVAIRNISGGGMDIFVDKFMETGTMLDLVIIVLKDTNPVVAQGEVVWCKKTNIEDEKVKNSFETGIKFTDIDIIELGRITSPK